MRQMASVINRIQSQHAMATCRLLKADVHVCTMAERRQAKNKGLSKSSRTFLEMLLRDLRVKNLPNQEPLMKAIEDVLNEPSTPGRRRRDTKSN